MAQNTAKQDKKPLKGTRPYAGVQSTIKASGLTRRGKDGASAVGGKTGGDGTNTELKSELAAAREDGDRLYVIEHSHTTLLLLRDDELRFFCIYSIPFLLCKSIHFHQLSLALLLFEPHVMLPSPHSASIRFSHTTQTRAGG